MPVDFDELSRQYDEEQRRKKQQETINLTPTEAALRGAGRGLITVLQAPTFGFADELAAGVAAVTGGDYVETRDKLRAMVEQERAANPILSATTGLAASAPTMMIPGIGAGSLTGLGGRIASGAATGAAFGGLTAAGESKAEDIAGLAGDVTKGAAISGVTGGALPVATNVVGKVGKWVAQVTGAAPKLERIGSARDQLMAKIGIPASRQAEDAGSAFSAKNYAREKVAENLAEDVGMQGGTVEQGISRAERRLRTLGEGARIVDTGKRNVRALADVVAVTPGTSGNRLDAVQRARMATRGDEIISGAEKALGTRGESLGAALDRLAAERSAASAPLYAAVQDVAVTIDDDLAELIARAAPAHSQAARSSRWGGKPIDFSAMQKGSQVRLGDLNELKETLFDVARGLKRNEGATKESIKVDALRRALTDKLDEMSPKDSAGNSVYKMARDAWAGPSAAMEAADVGAKFINAPRGELDDAIKAMGASEREAMRIGAANALKDLAGTQSGQTRLLKFWADPATRDRLKMVFGKDYKDLKKTLLIAGEKKKIERIGSGSQTMPREEAGRALDEPAVQGAVDVATGGVRNALTAALLRGSQGIQTPRPVRNEIGKILFGQNAAEELAQIRRYQAAVDAERLRRAQLAGKFAGIQTPEQ